MNRAQMTSLNNYCDILSKQGTVVLLAGKPEPGSGDIELTVFSLPGEPTSETLLEALHRLINHEDYHNRRVYLTIRKMNE